MKARSLFFAALAMVMAACVPTEGPNDVAPEFKVSGVKDNTISVGADKKNVTVSVTSNLSWSVECAAGWVTIDPKSYIAKEDKTSETVKVKVSVSANEVEEPREAELVFVAEGVDPVKVTLNQAAKEHEYKTITVFDLTEYAPVSDYSIKAPALGGSVSFTVQANSDWTVEAPEWAVVTPSSFTFSDNDLADVTVSFEANFVEAHEGEIRFKGDFEADLVVPVSQAVVVTMGLTLGTVESKSIGFTTNPSYEEFLYMVMCESKSYIDQFESDEELLAAEVEWLQDLASRNSMSFKDVVDKFAYYGSGEGVIEAWYDSDYVLYAYGITYEGEIITKLEKIAVHTPLYDFKFAGTAIWHDVAMGEMFGTGQRDLPCDVYTVEGLDGHYFFRSPYNYANLCGWFVNATPEEFFPEKDAYTKDVYIEIDCTDPSAVVYEMQEIGLNVNDEYGWMSVGSTYGQYNYTGTLENNVISFASGYLLVIFPDEVNDDGSVGGLYGIDLAKYGNFTITIDTDATESVYPKDPEGTGTTMAKAYSKPVVPVVANQFTRERISKRTILK